MKKTCIALGFFFIASLAEAKMVSIDLSDVSGVGSGKLVVTYEPASDPVRNFAQYVQVIFAADTVLVGFENGLDAVIQENKQVPTGNGTTSDNVTFKIHLNCDSGTGTCVGALLRSTLTLSGSDVATNINHQFQISKNGTAVKFKDGSQSIHLILSN